MRNHKDHLIKQGSSIRQALIQLDALASDAILFVMSDSDRLVGSLTDGDVRRGLIRGVSIEDPVDGIIQQQPRYLKKGERDIQKVIDFREKDFRVIPILDKDDCVVNVVNFREIKSYLPVDAVIMAGGKGTRLLPLTTDTPKPLLRVGDRPIIEHNLNRLALFGIDDFWISLNYLGDQIEAYFGNGDSRNLCIQYVREDQPLGTIGAVSKINNFEHEYILVTNSDLLTNLDYEHFFLDFIEKEADLAVVTIPYQVNIPYAVLEASNGHVLSFKEKPTYTYYSNGGIYLMKRSILKYLPQNMMYDATDLMDKVIKEGLKVISYPLAGYWLDIGKPEDYEKAQKDINQIKF